MALEPVSNPWRCRLTRVCIIGHYGMEVAQRRERATRRRTTPGNDTHSPIGLGRVRERLTDVGLWHAMTIHSFTMSYGDWATAGVLVNELASPALFLNLPTLETASYGQILGEPAYASLRLLMRLPPRWEVSGRDVFVCENPNLLAIAAAALGERCAPLICTNGMPATAQRTLLQQLTRVGAKLRYHGDFDWAGIIIGNYVIREYAATSWRFGKVEYATAAADGSGKLMAELSTRESRPRPLLTATGFRD
jgi:hypothetical protein